MFRPNICCENIVLNYQIKCICQLSVWQILMTGQFSPKVFSCIWEWQILRIVVHFCTKWVTNFKDFGQFLHQVFSCIWVHECSCTCEWQIFNDWFNFSLICILLSLSKFLDLNWSRTRKGAWGCQKPLLIADWLANYYIYQERCPTSSEASRPAAEPEIQPSQW